MKKGFYEIVFLSPYTMTVLKWLLVSLYFSVVTFRPWLFASFYLRRVYRYISSQKWDSESILCTFWWAKHFKKFRWCREHWFYILIIPKSNKIISGKEIVEQKKRDRNFFFSPNRFVNLSEYIWTFLDFFLICENPVYRKMFESYLRVVSKLLKCSA